MSLKIHQQVMEIARKDGLPISLAAWSLFLSMVDRANDMGNNIYASMVTLGRVAHLKKTAVFEAKSELVKLGLILPWGKRKHRNGYTVIYRINLDLLDKLEKAEDPSEVWTCPPNEGVRITDMSAKRTPKCSPHEHQDVRITNTEAVLKLSKKQPEEKAASAASLNSKSKAESQDREDYQQSPVQPKSESPAKRKGFDPIPQLISKGKDSPVKPSPVPLKKESVPAARLEHREFWQTWADDLEDDEGVIKADDIRRAIRFHSAPECADTWYRRQGWSKRLVKSNARRLVDAVPFDYNPDKPKPVKKPVEVLKGDPDCKACRGSGKEILYQGNRRVNIRCRKCNPKLIEAA